MEWKDHKRHTEARFWKVGCIYPYLENGMSSISRFLVLHNVLKETDRKYVKKTVQTTWS